MNGNAANRAGSLLWPVALIVTSIAVWAWVHSKETPVPAVPPGPTFEPKLKLDDRRAQFFEQEITPLLEEFDRKNRAAIDACIRRVDDAFQSYRRGIPAFVEDVTSYTTRARVAWNKAWYGDEEVMRLVNEKFSTHIFSEQRLVRDVTAALEDFRADVQANLSEFYASAKVRISGSDLDPGIEIGDFQSFANQVQATAATFAADRAKESVVQGIVNLVLGEVVTSTTVRLVTPMVTSMLAGVAEGGAVGTVGGPVGTAIGAVGGLVVGMVVDWWLTDRYAASLTADMEGLLTTIRNAIVDGSGRNPKALRRALKETADALRVGVHTTLAERLAAATS